MGSDNNFDTEKTIRAYLPQIIHMSLATSNQNKPWVCEVHFAYDDDLNIYFRSLSSRRHSQDIAATPSVAGNIVTQHFLSQPPRAVYFEGTAKMLEPGEEETIAAGCIKQRYDLGDEILDEAHREDGHKIYKITVSDYYVFDSLKSRPGQKYHLPWKQ